ncbi:hypothetical protein Fmac_021583 [Flemingia macrophylla]|uniref:Uncharacterized protein n=1 Tax=Flemingia macrophylla TaxID=520843 RepID=A0ABD1LXC7_9FABA
MFDSIPPVDAILLKVIVLLLLLETLQTTHYFRKEQTSVEITLGEEDRKHFSLRVEDSDSDKKFLQHEVFPSYLANCQNA